MSIHDNGHGRCYAICDAEGCDSCVIDLPRDRAAASRILQNFFGWTARRAPDGRPTDACALCAPRAQKKRRRSRYTGSWRSPKTTKETTT